MAEVELRQIGPYPTTDLLRTSSTSDFYQATHRKKTVLIQWLKIALAEHEQKEAFLARAKQLTRLKDRNIVEVSGAGFDGDHAYLVIEYIAGETLRQRFAPGTRLAPDEVKRILSPVAGALNYAHLKNIIHGNLHPGVLRARTPNEVLLSEFALTPPGFAFSLDDDEFAVPYMAPEQLQGHAVPASDQYALAVMAYEWLCGQRPYPATERSLLLQQQALTPLTSPHDLNPALSPTAAEVILQALAQNPAERFPNTQTFADHYLHALMGLPLKKITSSTPARIAPPATPRQSESQVSAHTLDNHHEPPAPSLPLAHQSGVALIPATPDDGPPPQQDIHAPLVTAANDQPAAREKHTNDATAEQAISIATPPTTSRSAHAPSWDEEEERLFDDFDDGLDDPTTVETKVSHLQTRVVQDLCQGGILSQRLPGYEERPAQVAMATMISRAIKQHVPAIIEAGTGTGKSLAYLVPIVRSGQVAIVSTANKALQEQLFYKDIPFIQKHIKHFDAALVKGVSNYVCLERVESERVGMQFYVKNRDFQRLVQITNDPESGFNGDFETLGFQLPGDIRSHVATDSDQCAWSKCNYFGDCYVRQMRENAERAQVIVVNHTLLLLDAAMGGFLLPERDMIVLDEAHHLEEEATRSFTITINPAQIQTLLQQRMLKDHSQLSLQDATLQAAQTMWLRLDQAITLGFKGRANLEGPLEEGLRLASVVSDLADSLRKQRPKDLPEKEGQIYDKLLKRTQNLSENIRTVFSVAAPDKFVYYVERVEGSASRGFVLQVSAAPLDVTSWLKERLFNKSNVICTSATLATVGTNPARPEEKGPNFAYFRKRVGLDPLERKDVLEQVLPLAFDYESNALLYLPRDLPAPAFGQGSDDYMKAIAREMYRLVKLSSGRAFLLFSSKRMLDRAYELMAPHLPYPLLKQGDMTRLELTRRFRQEEGAVLFGLKSFWEGVDIAGEALSLVVIDKLPFDPPDDPVHEARVALMKAAGENWFGTYVLPQAVLRLKQGIGRLLRTREDRGVMAILDTRLHTKGYGKQVIEALPPARRTSNIRDVERFFA